MKAYAVSDRYDPDYGCVVVFAKTAGKAKVKAMKITDSFYDSSFTDLQAHREPAFDKYYSKSKEWLDWNCPDDRIFLVKHGWRCSVEIACEGEMCPAHRYCDRYEGGL